MSLYIRNLGLLICSSIFYVRYNKDKNINKKNNIKILILILFLSYLLIKIDNSNYYLNVLFEFIACALITLTVDKRFIKSIMIMISSFVLSYITLGISVLLTVFILMPAPYSFGLKYRQIIIFVFQMVMVTILTNIKRLKSGMLLLNRRRYGVLWLLIISGILLLVIILNGTFDKYYFVPVSIFLGISIFAFIYWRSIITQYYLERLTLSNIDSLNAELEEKNCYIAKILADNERLQKINHRNYKLIPAMYESVEEYMKGAINLAEDNIGKETNNMSGFINDGRKLLSELQILKDEWGDEADKEAAEETTDIPLSGITRLDYILKYMNKEAEKVGVSFIVSIDNDLEILTESNITEEDISTLIADLVQNAIIATKYNGGRQVHIIIGTVNERLSIEIFDSGIPFDREVLLKYGKQQITTHADDKGSGIGMMQTSEILDKCKASLYIDEFSGEEGLYTKKVSVVFNRKHQYVLYTNRGDDDVTYLKKRADLTVVKK